MSYFKTMRSEVCSRPCWVIGCLVDLAKCYTQFEELDGFQSQTIVFLPAPP